LIRQVCGADPLPSGTTTLEETLMLRWAIIFLVVALVAAVLGFGGIANFSFEIAKFVAIIAVILFVVSLVMGGMRGRGTRL
jgi:uncharacterized membrane protein YtjA (UPF0391 family)